MALPVFIGVPSIIDVWEVQVLLHSVIGLEVITKRKGVVVRWV